MKRYRIYGSTVNLEDKEGKWILYDDFVDSILTRIKELEADKYIDSEHKKQRIKELRNLIKWK